ncbi:MAG: M10 family metallopeptidase C-terminal domain-containing protein [Gemmataceae bacterium]
MDEAAPTPTDDGGNDTLDFSSYQGGGVTLNLASAAPQTSYLGSTTTPRLAIQLSSGSGIENVVGSPAVDHITGNARANVFEGADITVDRISQSPAPAWNGRTQVVYLQFLPAGASRTPFSVANPDQVHTYTLDEEIAIAQQIEQDYAAFTVPTHKDGNGAAITTLIDGTRPDQAGYLPYFRFYIVDATGQVRDDSGVAVASVTDPFTGHSLPTHFTNLFLAPVD